MRVLSVRQPWAWFIVRGLKGVENRTWHTNFLGPVLIHASKGMTKRAYDDAMEFVEDSVRNAPAVLLELPDHDQLERGGIVGVTEILDCRKNKGLFDLDDWETDAGYAWLFGEAAPLPFTPCTGTLGLWDAPEWVVQQLGLYLLCDHPGGVHRNGSWEGAMFNRKEREALGEALVKTRDPFSESSQFYEWRTTEFGARVAAAWETP